MSSRTIQYSSNCNVEKIQINCSHQWEIPDFGTWIKENKGKWKDGPVFSPVEPNHLQLLVYGSGASGVRILLKNCKAAPATLALVSLSFSGWGFQNVGHGHTQMGLVTSSTPPKASLDLRFSEEFRLNWESKSEGTWKRKSGSFPEQLRGNTCELFQFIKRTPLTQNKSKMN